MRKLYAILFLCSISFAFPGKKDTSTPNTSTKLNHYRTKSAYSELDDVSYEEQLSAYYQLHNFEESESGSEESTSVSFSGSSQNIIHTLENDEITESKYMDCDGNCTSSLSFEYDKSGNLTKLIDNNDIIYTLEYTDYGDFLSGAVNERFQYLNQYDGNGILTKKDFSNGDSIDFEYDEDILSRISYEDGSSFSFTYDKDVESDTKTIYKREDITGDGTEYNYIGDDLTGIIGENSSIKYTFSNGSISNRTYKYYTSEFSVSYTDDSVSYLDYDIECEEDENGRVSGQTISEDSNQISETYYVYDSEWLSPSVMYTDSEETGYIYDENNNLVSVVSGEEETVYGYDERNQLTSEADQTEERLYSYDKFGNLVSKTVSGNTEDYQEFFYDPDNRLTYRNGEPIEYDNYGNPLNYKDFMLSWERGAKLSTLFQWGKNISYSYDDQGFRTRKTINNDVHSYFNDEKGNTIFESSNDEMLFFLYGKQNDLLGFTWETTQFKKNYFYTKNALGDITGILDADGNQVVKYRYDAYGNILEISGEEADTAGRANPYRYRGYRYDEETGFYYLNSRYYDPEIGRFISPDDIYALNRQPIAANYNLYSYCADNPIKYIDRTGNAAITVIGITVSFGKLVIITFCAIILFMCIFFPNQVTDAVTNAYRWIKDFFDACKKASTTWWEQLTKSCKPHVHHIVAKTDHRAEEARRILQSAGIEPLTDARNLVILKARFHLKLHTSLYHTVCNSTFSAVKSKGNAAIANTLLTMKIILSLINSYQ